MSVSARHAVLGHHLINGVAADAVVGLDELFDFVAGREKGPHGQPGQQPDIIEHAQVEGVAGGHLQCAILAGNGHQSLAENELCRQQTQHVLVDGHVGQIHHSKIEMLSQRRQHLAFGEVVQSDDGTINPQAVGLLQPLGLGQLFVSQQTFFNQYVGDPHIVCNVRNSATKRRALNSDFGLGRPEAPRHSR